MIIIKYWEFLAQRHLRIFRKRIEKWRGNTIQIFTQMTMPQKSSLKKFRQLSMYSMIPVSGKCTIGTEALLKALELEEEVEEEVAGHRRGSLMDFSLVERWI
jgi:hypothetical protein